MHFRIRIKSCLVFMLLIQMGCTHVPVRSSSSVLAHADLQHLQAQINTSIQQVNPHVSVGIHVISLAHNKTLYAKNPDQLFTPASTLKVVTAAAALHYLSPGYRFTTKLLTSVQKRTAGRLKDLYLVGDGDPTLTWSHLIRMANELKQRGIRVIEGDVVIDDSAFDNLLWGKGWMWDDRFVAYSAPVEAVNCNSNSLQLRIVPARQVGKPARVLMTPPTQFVNIQAQVTTGKRTVPQRISYTVKDPRFPNARDLKQGLQNGQTILLEGTLPRTASPRIIHFAVGEPSLFTGTLLRELLQAQGIQVKGKVRRGPAPEHAQQLAVHRSVLLREMLVEILRTSNNHATEILLKTIGRHIQKGSVGSFKDGKKALMHFLEQTAGIQSGELHVADASGLSRYNAMTPRHITALESSMWRQFSLQPDFVGSFPTIKENKKFIGQFLSEEQAKNIRVKTGSMKSVSNLVGYMVTHRGDPLGFAIFINGFVGSAKIYRGLSEKILSILYKIPKISL